LPVSDKVFLFFVALLSVIITGCSLPNPVQPTVEEEYKAERKLVQLQSCVDDEDYINAKFILIGLQKDFSHTNLYQTHSKRINEIANKIEKKTRGIKVEDRIEYFFVPSRLETNLWKEYMSRAERIVSRNKGRTGITVLRVIFEDEEVECPSVRADWESDSQIYIYRGGGYSNTGSFKSGDAVFVGSEFRRYDESDSNDKDIPVIGNVIIGGIYHYPTKLRVEIQKGKATAFGEIIVRSIPKEYRCNLIVKVKTEEGIKSTDAGVSLKVAGFYPGITEPVRDGCCLFESIGPGNYNVEIAPNNNIGSSSQPAVVVAGKTSEVTINAYRHRVIELDWRFRSSKEPNNCLSGRKLMKTKESWQPDEEWADVHYPVIRLGDWIDNTCRISPSNGNLMLVTTDKPFEEMDFPLNISSAFRDYPIKEGDIFLWRQDDRKEGFLEALIRIRKITPTGMTEE
jgi:hypothetical protein